MLEAMRLKGHKKARSVGGSGPVSVFQVGFSSSWRKLSPGLFTNNSKVVLY
jgi:hypothetical protein